MNGVRRILSVLLVAGAMARAEWGTSPLGAFAVATLADDAVVARLRARFHASGTPVFLLGNPVAGVQQGDILRFPDKAYLVDADVWQTLSAEGALRALRQSPVVRVQAAANPSSWTARARIVSGSREKKLYEFGAALLKSLEQSMGGVPQGQKLFLSLEGGQLVLTAPATFLDKLRAAPPAAAAAIPEPVERVPHGRPVWTSRPPDDTLRLGQKMSSRQWAADDSGGPTADFAYTVQGNLPTGLVWDEGSRTLQGTVLDTGNFDSRWTVSNERGSDTFTWKVCARPTRAVPRVATPTLRVEMPWDTLLERRWYTWDPMGVRAEWADDGIALDSVTGDGDAIWNGTVLVFRPPTAGAMHLHFVFHANGARRTLDLAKPVKSYLPPVFLSRLGGSAILEGDTRTYHPVVVDPNGGPVQILAEFAPDAPMTWNGKDLVVTPTRPGVWAVRLEARDTLDQVAVQWVEFRSSATSKTAVTIRHRWESGAAPWEAEVDLGAGRIGLFTPDIVRLVSWRTWTRQDWPFVYGGVELLGAQSRRHGNSLGGDLGFTLRIPDPKILTGGIMARLRGTASAQPLLPLSFEGETFGWLRQGIFLTDTVGYNGLVASQVGGSGDPEADARYGKVFKQVQSDDFDRHNLVVFTRLEGWLHFPLGLGAGFGVWREDLPVKDQYDQRVGIGLRWRPVTRVGSFSTAVRAGWGSAKTGASVWGDLVWSTGILP